MFRRVKPGEANTVNKKNHNSFERDNDDDDFVYA
jgi:hypothetical protein